MPGCTAKAHPGLCQRGLAAGERTAGAHHGHAPLTNSAHLALHGSNEYLVEFGLTRTVVHLVDHRLGAQFADRCGRLQVGRRQGEQPGGQVHDGAGQPVAGAQYHPLRRPSLGQRIDHVVPAVVRPR